VSVATEIVDGREMASSIAVQSGAHGAAARDFTQAPSDADDGVADTSYRSVLRTIDPAAAASRRTQRARQSLQIDLPSGPNAFQSSSEKSEVVLRSLQKLTLGPR
jgi:hypothetical protein